MDFSPAEYEKGTLEGAAEKIGIDIYATGIYVSK
jgi:hypothetical protein